MDLFDPLSSEGGEATLATWLEQEMLIPMIRRIYWKEGDMRPVRFMVPLVAGFALLGSPLASSGSARAAFPGANGRIAFDSNRAGNYQIYSMNPDGTGVKRLTSDSGNDYAPGWSPDGTKIVFWSDRDGNAEIYSMNADGTGQVDLTNTSTSDEVWPFWSSDGQKIGFNAGGAGPIFVMNADGSGRTTVRDWLGAATSWSPDGTKILAHTDFDGDQEIYTMAPDGSSLTKLTDNTLFDADSHWSADGSKIYFERGLLGRRREIFSMNPDGTGATRLTHSTSDKYWPVGSPDGGKIAFTSYVGGDGDIYTMNPDGSSPINLTKSSSFNDERPDWQPVASRSA